MARLGAFVAAGLFVAGQADEPSCAHVLGWKKDFGIDGEPCGFGSQLKKGADKLLCKDFKGGHCSYVDCCVDGVVPPKVPAIKIPNLAPKAKKAGEGDKTEPFDSSASDSSGSQLQSAFSGSSGSLKSSYSDSLNTGSMASDSISKSSESSGSTASGSSGFFLPIWQWATVVSLALCLAAAVAGALKGNKKAKKRSAKKAAPAPATTEPATADPVFEVAPLLPAAPIAVGPYGQALPAMTTAGAPVYAQYPQAQVVYAAPAAVPANYVVAEPGAGFVYSTQPMPLQPLQPVFTQ